MKRSALLTLVVVVIALVIVGLVVALGGNDEEPIESTTTQTNTTTDSTVNPPTTNTTPTPSTDTQSGAAAITIDNFSFDPKSLTVKKGTTVTWKNNDSVNHTVTPDAGDVTEDFKGSESLATGDTYSVTFNATGTYSYHCTPHPQMKASVTVID